MSSHEFAEWIAYNRLEPFGHERHDLGHAIVASTIANVNRDSKQKADPFEPSDFLPVFEEQDPVEQTEILRNKLKGAFSALGGTQADR